MVPVVGAPYSFETRYDGRRHPHYGRFLALEQDRLVRMTWLTTAGTKGVETVVTVEFTPRGDGTLVRLTHEGFPDEDTRAGHREAWLRVLEHQEKKLTGG